MYELLFSSYQPLAKDFRKHHCKVMFYYIRQQLTNWMQEERQQELEQTDAALALINDDLQDYEKQIQAIQYGHVQLQWEIRTKDWHIEGWRNTINHLRERYVDHAKKQTWQMWWYSTLTYIQR